MPRSPPIACRAAIATAAILLSGCPKSVDPPAKPAPVRPALVRLIVVDDPALVKQITRVKGEWKARSGADLEIRAMTPAELAAAKSLQADAVIYPADELGSLVERRLIRPLPSEWLERETYRKSDLFEPCGLADLKWGEQIYAAPFGSPVFVVLYRRDLFEHFHLDPPRTWEEYRRLVQFFAKRKNSDGSPTQLPANWSAAVEPLAAGWAGKLLLARTAAYAKHRDYYATLFDKETMAPLITLPPFVRALEELVAAAKPTSAISLSATPADARSAILSGQAALAIAWPTAAETSTETAPAPVEIGFTELPGSTEAYNPKDKSWQPLAPADDSRAPGSGPRAPAPSSVPLLCISGRCGSVTVESTSGEFAFQLLAWLSGNEWSPQICPASPATTLFCRADLSQPGRWVEPGLSPAAAKEYADVVVRSFSRPQWLECPRIPGHAEYMAALDEAVRAAVEEKQSPAEALARTADRWREITARLGLDSQRAAYNRSLGLEP